MLVFLVLKQLYGAVHVTGDLLHVRLDHDHLSKPQVADPHQFVRDVVDLLKIGIALGALGFGCNLDQQLRGFAADLTPHVPFELGLYDHFVGLDRLFVAPHQQKHLRILVGGIPVELVDRLRRLVRVCLEKGMVDALRFSVAAPREVDVAECKLHGPGFLAVLIRLPGDDSLGFLELALGGQDLDFHGLDDRTCGGIVDPREHHLGIPGQPQLPQSAHVIDLLLRGGIDIFFYRGSAVRAGQQDRDREKTQQGR